MGEGDGHLMAVAVPNGCRGFGTSAPTGAGQLRTGLPSYYHTFVLAVTSKSVVFLIF